MKPSTIYLRLAQSAPMQELALLLDPTEQRLVDRLAALWGDDSKPTVMQTMKMDTESTSPSTAHRRLKSLRAKGLIELVHDERDSRTKYVMPTPALLKLFDQLGAAMREAAAEGVPA